MSRHDADNPVGAGRTDPLLAELRAARPEPPAEVLSPRTGPNRALVEEIIMTATTDNALPTADPAPRRAARPRRLALLAGAVAASVVAAGAILIAPWGVEGSSADALVRDAAVATRAALADSGRATTTVVNVVDGERTEPQVTLFEFAGGDERYRPEAGGYDNRIVEGENYVLGFDSRHPDQWYHVLCNEGIQRATPDPRSLASVLSLAADFEVVGEEVVDGVPTTHLRARNPGAIPADAIVGESFEEAVTTFDIWVDGDDVARRIEADVERTGEVVDALTGEEVTESTEWTIEFSDLGEDIVIAAPTDFEDHTCSE